MKPNLGSWERIARLLLGLAIGAWVLFDRDTNWILLTISVFLILNGLLGRCYLWKALGINTCTQEEKDKLKKSRC